jgi:hypothetical protein
VVIGNKDVGDQFVGNNQIKFVDEDTLYDGMTFNTIKNIIEEIYPSAIRKTGWYFQQFLKIAYALISESNAYLVWDGDTIPLKRLEFINSESGRYYFNLIKTRARFVQAYFNTLGKLFYPPLKRVIKESFISEHMIIDVKIMKEMISSIETNKNLCGDTFFERILRIIDRNSLGIGGFSEFETYGTYVYTKYPEKVEFRDLRTMRHGKVYFGDSPKIEDLEWARADYDTISFEGFESKWPISFLWQNTFVQAHFHMESVNKVVFPMISQHHEIIRAAKFMRARVRGIIDKGEEQK